MIIARRVEAEVPETVRTAAQIIGLLKSRVSGITLSRHAYADVLRTIYPDLADVGTRTHVESRVNVWAARPLTNLFLDELGEHRREGKNVWCFVCESDVLPERSLEACMNADQVWVPTTFVSDVCVAGGMPAEKIFVVPYYLPAPERVATVAPIEEPFTVLVSWDGKSSVHRKNVVGCIEAFRRAWPLSRKVRLRLKTRDLKDDHRALVLRAMDGDKRIVLDERTVDTVNEIFDGADVLLHLHRAEGYGRHIVEAMQRKVPVICTDYSGPCDWINPRNAWPVRVASMTTTAEQTEYQYPQGGRWALPDVNEAAMALREVRRGGDRVAAKIDRARRDMDGYASLENSREQMIRALCALGEVVR